MDKKRRACIERGREKGFGITCKNMYSSLVTQTVKCLPTMQETWIQSLGRKDLLEKETATHSSMLPGKPHGWRSLVDYSLRCSLSAQIHFYGP